uniref:Protein-cysteine N-palmitoyltransferase HHAT n=1 Tax=Castor canadensis TaxID=51338 RepID=A0A8B7TTR0_CASCN|nr:protein-cysteine N-palmitoyltransferase HHAT [Castor canadensis]
MARFGSQVTSRDHDPTVSAPFPCTRSLGGGEIRGGTARRRPPVARPPRGVRGDRIWGARARDRQGARARGRARAQLFQRAASGKPAPPGLGSGQRGVLGARGERERRRRPGQPGEHEEELDQEFELEPDPFFGGLKKDPTDFEWSFWMEWGKQRLVWLFFGHMAVSQLATLLAGKHRPWILMVYGMWACWYVLGAPGVAMVFLHSIIAFCVAQFRSLLLSWLCSLLLLSTMRLQGVEEVKRKWYKTENEYYLLQFTLTVRCLYYTSFSLEFCWQQLPASRASYSFPWMLAYIFYYPVFHNGPILSFPEFIKQVQQPELCSLRDNLCVLAQGLGRLLCWWGLAELMAHLMYMHAIYSSIPLLRTVSCWTLGGLALAQVLFFYVKYLVLFGVPALLMRLDGLKPPPLPRCVSTMFSFTGMWRYFDVGLHNFLIRYVYIPLGGSQHGLLGTLFSTAMTFAFVSYWHGSYDYLWCWAALNWLGVTVENGVRRLLETPCIQDSLVSRILACL